MTSPFHILDNDPRRDPAARRAAFETQRPPPALSDLFKSAEAYKPDPALLIAVNAALAVGAPLLLTGEPGTGKTQVAYWVAKQLGLAEERGFFRLSVQSTTTADALRYHFDNVAYFHKAYEQNLGAGERARPLDRREFVRPGVLWRAFRAGGRSVVLIDEIDKAPRDFPNDLLHVLDQYEITVGELPEGHSDRVVRLPEGHAPPFIVITSNSERRLPEPFLRRCVFHPLALDLSTVREAVEARRGDYPRLDAAMRAAAIGHFKKLRERDLRKKPSTAELLVWLTLLSARGAQPDELDERVPLSKLPFLGALLKDQEDLAQLGNG